MTKRTEAKDTRNEPTHALNVCSWSDKDLLLDIARHRNKRAFQEFYTRHERYFFNLAFRITQNADMATEATQEAMIKIWNVASRFDPTGNPRGWTTRIVMNEAFKLLRRKKTRREVRHSVMLDRQMSMEPQPDQLLESSDQQVFLRRLISSLPAFEHRLLTLYFGAKCSQDEMAKCLHVSQGKISTQLKKVLGKLRVELRSGEFVKQKNSCL